MSTDHEERGGHTSSHRTNKKERLITVFSATTAGFGSGLEEVAWILLVEGRDDEGGTGIVGGIG